jgi:hypothetical protein
MSKEKAFIEFVKEKKYINECPKIINKKELLALSNKNLSKNLYSKILKICS